MRQWHGGAELPSSVKLPQLCKQIFVIIIIIIIRRIEAYPF